MSSIEFESKSDVAADRAKYKAAVLKLYKMQVPENTDLTATRNERVFPLPAFVKPYVLPMLNDERDYIAFELLANLALTVPPALLLFCFNPSHWLGIGLLLARLLIFGARFMLTLHVVSHRKLFKNEYNWLNTLPETVGAFCLGMPPGFYHLHHVLMHHIENNVFPSDISSTMPHQRDSKWSLFHYITKYFTHAVFYLPYYALATKRYQLFFYHITFWLSYFVGSAYLYQFYPLQVMYLVVIPFIVLGYALMRGNYSQHVFVCPDQPFSNYRLSFHYINHADNQETYNDGYHIIHHANSRLHWSEVPQYFEDNIEKFAENDAFVFKECHNGHVLNWVLENDFKSLFKHYVQLQPDNIRTEEQFEAECRKRLVPIHKQPPSKKKQ